MKTCPKCQGKLEKVADITLDIEKHIFVVSGERCTSCQEEFPYEKETQKTIEIARKLRLWPESVKLEH